MPASGKKTKDKIIDSTQALVYKHGFSATSIDKIIDNASISKGAFFYHFKNKGELGRALILRYAERDLAHIDQTVKDAEESGTDAYTRFSAFIDILIKDVSTIQEPVPGCLITSYLYERAEYPDDIVEIVVDTFSKWCGRVAELLEKVDSENNCGPEFSPERHAKTLLAIVEGGYVISKAQGSISPLIELLEQYRQNVGRAMQ